MSQSSKRDYLKKIYPRYQKADAREKRRILDEFCANCGYHRKHAIRLLNGPPPGEARPRKRRPRRATYGSQLLSVLKAVWEAADYPWSARLKALLPEWMPWIRRRFRLSPELEGQLLAISARTIDYRLRAHKGKLRRRLYGRTKPGTLLKHHIPLKTDHWDVQVPGFTEIDLVSHSGNAASGDFCYSLNVTDIYTGWTETRAVLGRGQERIREALEEIRQALPFPLRGIDSDNGSEFINEHLLRYCRSLDIQFTRGRPYKKDDNAHIEQKNWTHVRRILGYVRYDSQAAQEAINDLYRNELRVFQNLFLPSVKLASKKRVGSRLRRCYEAPQTPWQRIKASSQADPRRLGELAEQRARLDPFQLSSCIQAKLEGVFRLSRDTAAPVRPEATSPGQHGQPSRRERERLRQEERRLDESSKKGGCQAVEMTHRGKRGKLQERVSHAFLRAWKSGKERRIPTFPQPRRRRARIPKS
jgi:integrase-like protein